MTYEEAVAEKKRREQEGTWKTGDQTADYQAAVDEATTRATKARTDAGDSWGGTWSDINDSMRLAASGFTMGGSDYIAAAGNTALGNIGSTIAPGWVDDPTFGDEVRKQDVEDKMARARIDASTGHTGSGRALEGGAGMLTLGKLGLLKPIAKAGLTAGGAYLASQMGNDPLSMYGAYAGGRDLLAKVFRKGGR